MSKGSNDLKMAGFPPGKGVPLLRNQGNERPAIQLLIEWADASLSPEVQNIFGLPVAASFDNVADPQHLDPASSSAPFTDPEWAEHIVDAPRSSMHRYRHRD